MAQSLVFDVSAANFRTEVLERSVTQPVLLDFWADWCAPCRALLPVLEAVAQEYGGAFAVGRVDSDKEAELASAFQVQGIPFCVLMVNGRPADGFTGAIPDAELRKFLAKAGIEPGQAEAAAPEVDPDSPVGRLQRARQAAATGDAAATRDLLAGIPEEEPEHEAAARLLEGIVLFEADLDREPGEAEAGLRGAREAVLGGRFDEAMDRALASIAADKGFRDGLGRRAMLLCFALLGEDSETCDPYRRRLATLLY